MKPTALPWHHNHGALAQSASVGASTIRRTGRLLAPSMPVSNSTSPRGPAAVVPHAVNDVADQHLALRDVRLGDHPLLAAAITHDAQEPRRERAQRLVERFRAGRQRVVVASSSTRPPSGHGGAGSVPATG